MKKVIIAVSILSILLTGCSASGTNSESSSSSSTTSSQSTNTAESNKTSSSASTAATNAANHSEEFATSLSDAITIYQKQYPETDITSIDINEKFGTHYYEITGVDDNTEYEMTINATNGEFRLEHEEALDPEERGGAKRQQEKLALDNLLPLSEINAIALKEAAGTIEEWSLEKELSTTYWEVSVRKDHQEINVAIDAQSGAILETEIDD